MKDKKCTWSQHLKWFLERRADPANKDLTDLEISQRYIAENLTVVDVALLFNEPCIDAIWEACWENLLANSPRIEVLMD